MDAAFVLTIGSFLPTAELFAYSCVLALVLLTVSAFLLTIGLLCLQLSFFAYSGKVLLISTSTDCKQRSSTVSKTAPTLSKKNFPPTKSLQI